MPQQNPTQATLAPLCRCKSSPIESADVLTFSRGMAPVAHVLFNKIMKYNPKNSKWLDRDRFVLS